MTNQIVGELEQVKFIQVPRSLNSKVDEVARGASSGDRISKPDLKLDIQKSPSIEEFHTFSIHGNPSWTAPILS